MTNAQYFGWSREDAAPLNESTQPRRLTWLTRRLEYVRTDYADDAIMDAVEPIEPALSVRRVS